jgi:hypothetical protein
VDLLHLGVQHPTDWAVRPVNGQHRISGVHQALDKPEIKMFGTAQLSAADNVYGVNHGLEGNAVVADMPSMDIDSTGIAFFLCFMCNFQK